jgi:dTDP-4-amino-4,6-dideoxygalactose transaminase
VIPVSKVAVGAEEEALVLEVLRSGQLAQGPMVERLEAAFRELTGTAHAVAVTSGTTALVAALEALEIEPGAEVITSPFTFAATLNAILEAGLTARFVDIGPDFTLDADAVAAAVTDRTRVLLPVHLYGLPADMATLAKVAEAHELAIVEDAAQAHGARVAGRPVGGFGLACFSLYATKNVTSGEGGVVTTDDAARAERLRILRNQGMRGRYEYVVPGHNYRMTDLQAAVALPQLGRIGALNEARRANAGRLRAGLAGVPGVVLPDEVPGREHVWHQFTVRVTAAAAVSRDAAGAALAERGVGSGVYYPRPVYDYPCYRNHPRVVLDPTPRADAAGAEVLSLPVHPQLSEGDLDTIITAVREVFRA